MTPILGKAAHGVKKATRYDRVLPDTVIYVIVVRDAGNREARKRTGFRRWAVASGQADCERRQFRES